MKFDITPQGINNAFEELDGSIKDLCRAHESKERAGK